MKQDSWTSNQSVIQIPPCSHQIFISVFLSQYLLVIASNAKSCTSGQSTALSPGLAVTNLVAATSEPKRQVFCSSCARSLYNGEHFHLERGRIRIREWSVVFSSSKIMLGRWDNSLIWLWFYSLGETLLSIVLRGPWFHLLPIFLAHCPFWWYLMEVFQSMASWGL